ncbi:SH3 domain-containing protein [Streptomyces daliensis]|uniref:SH3 domain-containing protein n=1 Tax=Streptomyces daliensis TaxID=299421 RepID=A0A8T4J2T1_9ACTN|nr:SH3 domain-containing protein [Streptomyces daliensis]
MTISAKILRRAGAAAACAALTLALAPVTALAAPGALTAPSAQASQSAAQRLDLVCTVNDNGVNYRGGPGSQYPVLGQVNKGQKMNAKGKEGSWVMGDLWGGRTGVWIHVAYLDC